MNETDKALELLEEMRPSFFCINILSWDHTDRRVVQCDPRHGHNEHIPSLIGEGDSIAEAICDAYTKWKSITILDEVKDHKQALLYVDGSKTAFRCSCGANVFTKLGESKSGDAEYVCNGCGTKYSGEK